MGKFRIIDGHCDSLGQLVSGERSLVEETLTGHWDLVRARKGDIALQFFAAYIESEYKPFLARHRGLELIEAALAFVDRNKNDVCLVKDKEDLAKLGQEDKIGLLLSVEGGEILGEDLWMLDIIFRLGVRSLGLTWNQRNAIGDGVGERESCGRLSNFGKEVIKKMNALGMLIDVSHLSEPCFWHVLEISDQPFIASHSNAYSVCAHPRNLTDHQLRALRDRKGLTGINFCPDFVKMNGKASIPDLVEHICHIAEIAGIETIGLGSDFDGIEETPRGLESAAKYPALLEELDKAGFSEEEIQKICYENFERVLNDVLK
ncbi:dipeptidase [Syntrophobotulus glycolicus DSM 8271]|uniref:Dipeptidase n=1 Tax=Syntrophobotulus glycolicus (strain DSM 8271 / FlGlyR) TaxID=645991 RepID=F0STX1_SYNGF|nr:dipeptidase [Syntrophobotulus glycolicus DSM 8271]